MKNTLTYFLGIAFFLIGCDDEVYVPKPKAYFRMDLPKHNYVWLDKQAPYSFKLPKCVQVSEPKMRKLESYWYNLEYKAYKAVMHLSYKPIQSEEDLNLFAEDARTFVYKHTVKSSGIEQERVFRPEDDVYGIVYHISGDAASPLQFTFTDSTRHFLRGALYFNHIPNEDSIAPVLKHLLVDLDTLKNSLHWKP